MVEDPEVFPYWIVGGAIPSDVSINKSYLVPAITLLMAFLKSIPRRPSLQFVYLDVSIVGYCLWPLLLYSICGFADPAAFFSAFWMTLAWGGSWILGRIWFCTDRDRIYLVKAVALSGLICLPLTAIEGICGLQLYKVLYQLHPFHADGVVRYVGYRPIGFFEHGNQYGIWVALSALASFGVWRVQEEHITRRNLWFGITGLLLLGSLAAQSLGALIFLICGIILVLFWSSRSVRWALMLACLTLITSLAVHLSGVLDLEHIARRTAFGESTLKLFRSLGRGSFLWRVSQDVRTLESLREALILGQNDWDWWRDSGTRPWGLWLLLVGQFGLIGLLLSYGALLLPACKALAECWKKNSSEPYFVKGLLGLLILFAVGDSILNSFLYYPVIFVAGALAKSSGNAI